MNKHSHFMPLLIAASVLTVSPSARAATLVDTGSPDGRLAMISGGSGGAETADDFVTTSAVSLSGGTFTGLIAGGSTTLASIVGVDVKIYRVFPLDSANPPDGTVPTRANSPSDVALLSARSAVGQVDFSASVLSNSFVATNSVRDGGIHLSPNQTTGGNGPITGQEVAFTFALASPFVLAADHYFFVPTVQLSDGGSFYWLSAARPIAGSGTPFAPDLQTWMRDASTSPEWLRTGTDIVGGSSTFNASFLLTGAPVAAPIPEPDTWLLLAVGFGAIGTAMREGRSRAGGLRKPDAR